MINGKILKLVNKEIKMTDNKYMKTYWSSFTKDMTKAMYIIRSDNKSWKLNDFLKSGVEDYNQFFLKEENNLIPNKDSILEIGCGMGRMLYATENRFNKTYGIDIDEGMIKFAKKLPPYNSKRNEFIVSDGLGTINLSNDIISYAISIICFQHMPYKDIQIKYINEIERVLKPNGIAKLMIQHENWKSNREVSCGYGVGLSSENFQSYLIKSDVIQIIESSGWKGDSGKRNFWVIFKKK
jgi:SAM-dependent methyltransferase